MYINSSFFLSFFSFFIYERKKSIKINFSRNINNKTMTALIFIIFMFRIQLKDINIVRFIRMQIKKKNWKIGSFIFKLIEIISAGEELEDITRVFR